MSIHSKQKVPPKTQPIIIEDDGDDDFHADQTPRAAYSRGATSASKVIAIESDSESDDEVNHLLGLLAPRPARHPAPMAAPAPTPVQRPNIHPAPIPEPVAAPAPAPVARAPRAQAHRAIPGQPKPFPGFGKRVAVDNHFLLSIIHYDPFPLSEQDNLDGTMADKWDNCLSVIQDEDPKTFGAMTPQLCYTSWLAFRDEYEQRMLSGDYWGEQSDEEREYCLSRRAQELKSERLHLLQNCYMMEVQAICKHSPSLKLELAEMSPQRKKVFCEEAGIALPGQQSTLMAAKDANTSYGSKYLSPASCI
ncbi:hypothetical protein BGZ82_006711 [Podila clonocystis]|nr:hypothetical protein BGZ82_006711 [Podila clonocystis]